MVQVVVAQVLVVQVVVAQVLVVQALVAQVVVAQAREMLQGGWLFGVYLQKEARCCTFHAKLQTYHRLLQHSGTSITNVCSTHFVESSGLNAKAKFLYFRVGVTRTLMLLVITGAATKLAVVTTRRR
jgi:hypothetical protein